MSTLIDSPVLADKTRELCQALLEHPAFLSAQQRMRSFIADAQARAHYESVASKGQELRQRQQADGLISEGEVRAFEADRDALLRNPVARDFLQAQSDLEQLRQSIEQYIALTLELGRLPNEEDLGSCGCGSGCGCHSH